MHYGAKKVVALSNVRRDGFIRVRKDAKFLKGGGIKHYKGPWYARLEPSSAALPPRRRPARQN